VCEHGNSIEVGVFIPAPELSHSGKPHWAVKKIDACIAPLVKALQSAGIYTRGCCCGHGSLVGDITLQDGRVLLIVNKDFLKNPRSYLVKMIAAYDKNGYLESK
jgi:hypothetical protein